METILRITQRKSVMMTIEGEVLTGGYRSMPYQPPMQPSVGLSDLGQLDPNALAPMDLYDSIFWGQ